MIISPDLPRAFIKDVGIVEEIVFVFSDGVDTAPVMDIAVPIPMEDNELTNSTSAIGVAAPPVNTIAAAESAPVATTAAPLQNNCQSNCPSASILLMGLS